MPNELDHPQVLRDAVQALCHEAERLSGAGRGSAALDTLRRAKRLCGRLPAPDRMTDSDLHCLSTTTMWLAVELHRVGDRAAGIEIARDLVAAARSATSVTETIRLDCLGTGLIWLCCWFDGTEEGADVVATVRETVALHRILAVDEPDLTRPALSRVLKKLAELLEERREYAEALHVLCEATALRRELFAEKPQTYLVSLADYASGLLELADRVDGDQAARSAAVREAVRAHRMAAECDPGRHEMRLANSLSALLAVLDDASEWHVGTEEPCPEALELAGEAVRVDRSVLAREQDVASWRALASALHDFSRHAMRAGEWGEAVAASREAVSIQRALVFDGAATATAAADTAAAAAEDGEHGRRLLADLLTRLALALLRTDRTREARAACEQARAILLSHDRPDFAALARLSGINSLLWTAAGDHPAAVAACREQIDFLNTAEAGAPMRDVVASLYTAWNLMSELLDGEGEPEESARAAERARDYRRRLLGTES
jgi:tetratricopeptide (TPR) repeat protein